MADDDRLGRQPADDPRVVLDDVLDALPGDPLDLRQAMESLPDQWEQGFTTFCVKPSRFINDARDLPTFCREAMQQATNLIG